jgi:hypothetical protein
VALVCGPLLARPERGPVGTASAFSVAIRRWTAKSTPIVETRLVVSPSAALGKIAATDRSTGFGAWNCSYSMGGMSPRDPCSRTVLNQATYLTVASSTSARERHTRSAISSVL